MASDSLFDLSALTVESINVMPADSVKALTEGHAMTELAGSCYTCSCWCTTSTPSFVLEEDLA